MYRPNGATPTMIRPIEPAEDAEQRWLGYHAYRVATGVLGQGRPVADVVAEDFHGPAFTDPLDPATAESDPSAPLDWDRVVASHDPAAGSVTLTADTGSARTVLRHGRYGLHALAPGADRPRVPAEPADVPAGPSTRADRPWPEGNATDASGLAAPVAASVQQLTDGLVADGLGRAAAVVHGGRLVAQSYAPGFGPAVPHNGWSATKSLAGALVGRLLQEGLLHLDQQAPIPEWAGDERSSITIADLMAMSSGLDCPLGMSAWARGDRHFAVYTGRADVHRDMTGLPLLTTPGTRCAYQNSDPILCARIAVETAAAHRIARPVDAPWTLLFDELGMDSVVLGSDATGNHLLSGMCLATAVDWARFGALQLGDGLWQGRRLLPAGWLDYVLTPAKADEEQVYGGGLCWLGHGMYAGVGGGGVPERTALAAGMYGQRVFVLPDQDLVVVRLGRDDNDPLLAETVGALAGLVG